MAENSKIEWTEHTANLWWGCTKVHAGCDHCYAETLSRRWDFDVWGNDKPRRLIKGFFRDLNRYQKAAEKAGRIHRVFVGSMMDIFEKPMPIQENGEVPKGASTDYFRGLFFQYISDGHYPNLMFLLLTKRPSNINKMIPESWKKNPPANVMFGCSPVNQETADKLIPQLLDVKGHRFLSIEPMLDKINIGQSVRLWQFRTTGGMYSTFFGDKIHWVIVGGESGHGRRPFDPDWARAIQKECNTAGAPFFMKQIDKVIPVPDDLLIREVPILFIKMDHMISKGVPPGTMVTVDKIVPEVTTYTVNKKE